MWKRLGSKKFKPTYLSALSLVMTLTMVFESSASAVYFYRVKKGESLSEILHQLNLKPIYGKNGTLEQTVAQNKKISSENQIFPSERVYLPVADSWVPPAGFEIKDSSEVVRLDRVIAAAASSPAAENIQAEAQSESPAVSAVVKDEEESPKSGLKVNLGLRYFRLDAVDSVSQGTSRLFSKLSPDFSAAWEMRWTDSTLIRLDGGVSLYSFEELNSSQSYVNGSGSLSHFSVGVDHKVNSRFTLGAAFHFQDEIFLVAQSASSLKVDRVMVVQPGISAHYDVFQKGKAAIGVLGEARVLLSSDVGVYQVKTGSAFQAGIYLRHDRNETSGLEGQITYGVTSQDSSIMSKSLKEIGLSIGYRFGLY